MDVYLDTSHFQKWHQSTLGNQEVEFLESLRADECCTFVLSSRHIDEIAIRLDHGAACDLGAFLDSLRHKWLRLSDHIFLYEVRLAFEAFQKSEDMPPELDAFVESYVDTLLGLDPKIYQAYKWASIEQVISDMVGEQDILRGDDPEAQENQLSGWSRLQARIITLLNNWRAAVDQRYKDVTAQWLTNGRTLKYQALDEDERTFISALVQRPEWTPSHWITFHMVFVPR